MAKNTIVHTRDSVFWNIIWEDRYTLKRISIFNMVLLSGLTFYMDSLLNICLAELQIPCKD